MHNYHSDIDLHDDHFVKNPHQRMVSDRLFKKRLSDASAAKSTASIRGYTENPDPEILDNYDYFYKTTKSLLVLFQIMGVMPIERSGIAMTTFRWTSKTTIYAYCIYGVETFFVLHVLQARVHLLLESGKRFDEYIYGIIFISILSPHFLLPILAWTNANEVAKFKNMWTKFQYKFFEIIGIPLLFERLTFITYSLCIISWVMGILIMLAQYYLQPDMELWHTAGYYHILAMLNCLVSLWFINCTSMGIAAKGLADSLHDALNSDEPAEKLAEYRDLWVDLSHLMQQLGKAYSGMYGLLCVLILLTTILASYGCLTETLDRGLSFKEVGLFLITIYCLCLLYIICNEAYHNSYRMGPVFRERLLNVNLIAVDLRTRQEVHMFLTAIDKNPPVMNLNQYADVNRKLLSSAVTSVCTYLVMLMQFRQTFMRNSTLAARRAKLRKIEKENEMKRTPIKVCMSLPMESNNVREIVTEMQLNKARTGYLLLFKTTELKKISKTSDPPAENGGPIASSVLDVNSIPSTSKEQNSLHPKKKSPYKEELESKALGTPKSAKPVKSVKRKKNVTEQKMSFKLKESGK
ncbi:hypothetical protein FQR65_LT03103 [Abscondita terminalis]|nr:hypothetical protein FQR65_LT03103 [Abscondita terminalis]